MKAKTFIDIRETADFFDVHPQTVRRWIRAGLVPATRVGPLGDFKIPRAAVERLLAAAEKEPGP
jgi:excisionase family DNA binding protein